MSNFQLDYGRGLIPARAGTTVGVFAHGCFKRAHPRSRGDHLPRTRRTPPPRGSSPLARGPPKGFSKPWVTIGLIPARAGTTSLEAVVFPDFGAHPRSRGDHPLVVLVRFGRAGSSPLARGPPLLEMRGESVQGLIPARAGTTGVAAGAPSRCRAHPRSRGDHSGKPRAATRVNGSSPLARGPRNAQRTFDQKQGLIPARAGTTVTFWNRR